MLRASKIILIILVAMWGLIGGVKNFADIDGGLGAVRAVLSPSEAAELPDWQKIESPIVIWLSWLTIALAKLATAGICFAGSLSMWRARKFEAAAFNAAKQIALVGCSVALAMMFGVFFVAGSTYFNLWQTQLGAVALPPAFRLTGCIALIAIFVHQDDL